MRNCGFIYSWILISQTKLYCKNHSVLIYAEEVEPHVNQPHTNIYLSIEGSKNDIMKNILISNVDLPKAGSYSEKYTF